MIKDIVTLTKELIKVPSVAGNSDNLIEVLEVAKQHLPGLPFTSFASNGIPSLFYSNKEKEVKNFKIILNAHLDVVPAVKKQFEPYEKDGKLYGRGAYDMKSASAAMICLFKELEGKLSYPLGLQLTTDEETGGQDGTKHQLEKGIRAEFAITGEGSSFRIINETKGIMNVKLTAHGKSAHSAYPWLGKNAILNMYEALDSILKQYPVPQEETPTTTVNVAHIENANTMNTIVPDDCTAYLNFRYVMNEKDTIIPKLQSLLPADVTLEIIRKENPPYSDPKGPYISLLKKEAKAILQIEPPIVRAHGGSDTRYFRQFDCDAVEFGPVGQGHHSDEEWVYIQSLEQYYKILKNFLLSLE